MDDVLTSEQMRRAEAAAMDSGAASGLDLMERAGKACVDAILAQWPDLAGATPRAMVLCGPGNNGGDGYVIARLLARKGWQVAVFCLGDPGRLPPDAHTNYRRWSELGETAPLDAAREAEPGALLVDALFGTGLTRPLEGLLRQLTEKTAARVMAVDIPSGLCADSGRVLGAAMRADLTVTFHAAKPGHYLADGPAQCGHLAVADIGLAHHSAEQTIRLCPAPDAQTLRKTSAGHKYSHGHALVLTGGAGRTGAARLAARGALRIGAGLVTLGPPGAAQQEVACQITALMLRRIDDDAALAEVLEDSRLTALCLGPGLGDARARALVPAALRAAHAPGIVLDADALTAYADAPHALFDQLHAGCVLTPHGGEFARLFPDIADRMRATPTKGPAYSKLDATREAAARAGCVVLFKGPDTVIADPSGRCSLCAAAYDRAAPQLATAGSGDVLAGFITGLLARGYAPMAAAEAAARMHVDCALSFGPGLIAEDLPEEVPKVLRGV
ncbi:NAD(P)H-hydrate dehydratase [Roseovarius tibetensis]|uniref:NAD(P)H-hydrate dehydratase n=1 Tax=Roseovarius tibetensis TaxID=2685897 RepID=UPI003D7F3A63